MSNRQKLIRGRNLISFLNSEAVNTCQSTVSSYLTRHNNLFEGLIASEKGYGRGKTNYYTFRGALIFFYMRALEPSISGVVVRADIAAQAASIVGSVSALTDIPEYFEFIHDDGMQITIRVPLLPVVRKLLGAQWE